MKDYVVPEAFHVRTCKASPELSSSASGAVDRSARGKRRLWRHRVLGASTTISDTALLSDGDNPTGTITFKLYGPDDANCSRTPAFTSSATVNGNGAYQSGAATITQVGTYRWVVDYSGDQNNNGAGPTACGESTETVIVSRAVTSLSSTASGPAAAPRVRRPRRRAGHVARAAQAIYDTAAAGGRHRADGTDHVPALRPGRRDLCTHADLHLERDRQRQRPIPVRTVHADRGGHLPMGRALFRRRQQPRRGPDSVRRSVRVARRQPGPTDDRHRGLGREYRSASRSATLPR